MLLSSSSLALLAQDFTDGPGRRPRHLGATAARSAVGPLEGGYRVVRVAGHVRALDAAVALACLPVATRLRESRDPDADGVDCGARLPGATGLFLACSPSPAATSPGGGADHPGQRGRGGAAAGRLRGGRAERAREPMLDLGLFAIPTFTASVVVRR